MALVLLQPLFAAPKLQGLSKSNCTRRRRISLVCKAKGSDKMDSLELLQDWKSIGLWLFGAGFVLGPLLDGIHSRVDLQVYDNFSINIAGLRTNIWVFPLLGTFYSVVGLLHLAVDSQYARNKLLEAPNLKKLSLCFLCLVLYLELSAELYKANVPYNIESYILFAAAQLNWALFESTWHGFAIASLVGVACPLLEIPIIRWFSLWHYPKPDVFILDKGVVTWVICCYFAYTPFLSNLSRFLRAYIAKTKIE